MLPGLYRFPDKNALLHWRIQFRCRTCVSRVGLPRCARKIDRGAEIRLNDFSLFNGPQQPGDNPREQDSQKNLANEVKKIEMNYRPRKSMPVKLNPAGEAQFQILIGTARSVNPGEKMRERKDEDYHRCERK
jgi:hypothetical protein